MFEGQANDPPAAFDAFRASLRELQNQAIAERTDIHFLLVRGGPPTDPRTGPDTDHGPNAGPNNAGN